MRSGLVEIGNVARLQIQTSSLKCGAGRARYYDPVAIASVDAISVTRDGATARIDDVERLDVHHNRHPDSKQRDGINPLSFGFRSHYAMMRARFGAHLTDGIAGENILVDTAHDVELSDVISGFVVMTSAGQEIAFSTVSVAHPCVEFSRFALHEPMADANVVSEALRYLDHGLRGYYASAATNEPGHIHVGDRVFRIVESD